LIITLGVVALSLHNLKDFYSFYGGMFFAIGLLFLFGGILLVLGLATVRTRSFFVGRRSFTNELICRPFRRKNPSF
jgi:hypothetical protein